MTLDRSFVELNRASRERMAALAERLSDEEMQTRVGEHWTVAIVFAHLAWWDRRVMYVLDMTDLGSRPTPRGGAHRSRNRGCVGQAARSVFTGIARRDL
jgi:hypothetical protein